MQHPICSVYKIHLPCGNIHLKFGYHLYRRHTKSDIPK